MHLVVRDVKKFCTCRNCRGRRSVAAAGGPNFKFLIFRSCFRLGLKYKFSFETLALAVRDIVQDYSQKNLVTTISSIEWDAEILDTYSYTILHVLTYFSQTTLCRKYVFRNEKTSGNHWKLLYRIYCPNHLNLTGALDPSLAIVTVTILAKLLNIYCMRFCAALQFMDDHAQLPPDTTWRWKP